MQLRSADPVGHRIQVWRRPVDEIAEAAVPAVFGDRPVQVNLGSAARARLDVHHRASEEVGPPVRPALRIEIKRTSKVDANAGCMPSFPVLQRPEHRVKLREHACPRRQLPEPLSRVEHDGLSADLGLGKPGAQPVSNHAARRRLDEITRDPSPIGSVPLDRAAHWATSCVCTS